MDMVPKVYNSNRKKRYNTVALIPYMWIAPAIIVMLALLAVPMLESLRNSFNSSKIPGTFEYAGLSNYIKLFKSTEFYISFINTMKFMTASVAFQMIFGLIGALALNKIVFAKSIFRSVALIPMMLTPVIVALCWRLFWDTDFGVINTILGMLGKEPVSWLGQTSTAIWAVTATDIWQNFPYVVMMLIAGLQGISKDYYEASVIDGASFVKQLRHITLPLLKPVIMLTLIIRTLFAFRAFEPVYILTNGGPDNSTLQLSLYVYRLGFRYFQTNRAAALSWVMLIICMIITLVYIKLLGGESNEKKG
jgi:multiple sugar transport system permease protein